MAYCTSGDLEEQISPANLIQLSDDANSGAVDATVITRAIADADAEIDSYCATRYDVPFSTVPAIIRKLSVEIAIYNLFARRQGAPADRKERYDNAIRLLRDLAKGVVTLGASAPGPSSDDGPAATTIKTDRKYTMGKASDSSSGTLDNY